MDIQELLNDKNLKAKPKTEALCKWFLNNPENVNDIIAIAKVSKDPIKATCIEGMEFATRTSSQIASAAWLDFVSETLTEKAPRVKWESAKVIGNIAHQYPDKLEKAVINLLNNSEHSGTVVRWSAAFALGQILQTKTPLKKDLISAIESICKREEKTSIRKIYLEALKKVKFNVRTADR